MNYNSLINLMLKTKNELESGKINTVNAFYKLKGAGVDSFIDSWFIDLRGLIFNLGNPGGAIDDDKSVNHRIKTVANIWYGDTNRTACDRVLSQLDNTLIDPDGSDGCETVTPGDLVNMIKDELTGVEL